MIYLIIGSLLLISLFILVIVLSHRKKSIKSPSLLLRTTEELGELGRKLKKESEKIKAIEKMLLTSDTGTETTSYILKKLLTESRLSIEAFQKVIYEILSSLPYHLNVSKNDTSVFLVIGVNGVGKTLSCAKIANLFKKQGYSPFLIAGDTFRAAAIEQLLILGRKIKVPVFHQKEGADPGAVIFDGISHARKEGYNPVIIDTAGRSHVNQNLLEELKKVVRVITKVNNTPPHEILTVVDANLGQSSARQISTFKEIGKISGVILTKMDSTAKGGVILHIIKNEGVPVKFVSFGEDIDSISLFDPESFTQRFCEPFRLITDEGGET